jgi:hypothetical protein
MTILMMKSTRIESENVFYNEKNPALVGFFATNQALISCRSIIS